MWWVTMMMVESDLGDDVAGEVVEVGRAHRVEPGVGLVEEQDLGLHHQRPGETGALAHPAGDLVGHLVHRALEPDQLELLDDDLRISFSDLLVCSRSGKAVLS
jgi:hypothetical protein